MVLDIEAFADVTAFRKEVHEMLDVMKSSPTLPGVDEVRLRGEIGTPLSGTHKPWASVGRSTAQGSG
jgi:LDH2 family malate/lactate/ureidoglycolate dehydrogenase